MQHLKTEDGKPNVFLFYSLSFKYKQIPKVNHSATTATATATATATTTVTKSIARSIHLKMEQLQLDKRTNLS